MNKVLRCKFHDESSIRNTKEISSDINNIYTLWFAKASLQNGRGSSTRCLRAAQNLPQSGCTFGCWGRFLSPLGYTVSFYAAARPLKTKTIISLKNLLFSVLPVPPLSVLLQVSVSASLFPFLPQRSAKAALKLPNKISLKPCRLVHRLDIFLIWQRSPNVLVTA